MNFEKINSGLIMTPKDRCSGCSDNGQQVYSGKHSGQAATKANRCIAK